MRYLHIHRLAELPDISGLAPFKAVICLEDEVSATRMEQISAWLVEMGCRYVMSRGEYSNSWCDAVRRANLATFDIDTMSARDFVMTTGHRYESLKSVLWYAKRIAKHPEVEFKDCVILDFGTRSRSAECESVYHRA